MTLKDLTEAIYRKSIADHPRVPAHAFARKRFTDKTANGLTAAILAFCKLYDVMATRTGVEGKYRAGETGVDAIGRTRIMKGHYIPGDNKGQGDVQIILKGKIYSVEVKIGEDRQRESQKEFQAKIEKAGGVYAIVHNWQEFYNYYRIWTKTRR